MLKGGFAESTSDVVELKEDDPWAVDAMLRHIYGFEYKSTTKPSEQEMSLCEFHVNVAVTAKKYGIEKLQTIAMAAAEGVTSAWRTNEAIPSKEADDREVVFSTIQMLARYEDHLEAIQALGKKLVDRHMVSLYQSEDFRSWLEDHKVYGLEKAALAVARGHKRGEKKPDLLVCKYCFKAWQPAAAAMDHYCTGSSVTDKAARATVLSVVFA
jgi:hypothetical protein